MKFPRSLIPLHLLVLLTPRSAIAQTTCRRVTSSTNTLAAGTSAAAGTVAAAALSTGSTIGLTTASTTTSSGTVVIMNTVVTTTTTTMANTCPMDAIAETMTVITTLSAGQSAFTSTIGTDMETLLIGVPATDIPTTSATDPGTVTVTSSIPAGFSPYTSTIPETGTQSGTVIYGVPSALLGTQTTTITLDPNSQGFTSTFQATGTNSGTVIVGLPGAQPVTTTITSGDVFFTTTTTGSDNTPTVEIITPTTITVTSTVAAEVTSTFTTTGDNGQATVEVDLPCRTPGLRASYFTNPFRRSDINTPYTNFDPSVFPAAAESGSTAGLFLYFARYNGDIAFDVASNVASSIYGVDIAINNRAVQVETYIYSPIAQTIKFEAQSDDIGFGYIGTKAYAGPFTRANADEFEVAGNDGTAGETRTSNAVITVAAGSFTPLRFINGFDLYTSGANAPYNQAIVRYTIINEATGATAQYKLYSDVCPQDATDFPDNGA